MKVKALIERLQDIANEHGDVEVMFEEPNTDEIFEANIVKFRVADNEEFPEDWDMPEGFSFIVIRN